MRDEKYEKTYPMNQIITLLHKGTGQQLLDELNANRGIDNGIGDHINDCRICQRKLRRSKGASK